VSGYTRQEVARRSGVAPEYLDRLVELGILTPAAGGEFSPGDVLRARWLQSLERAGVPLAGIAAAVRDGALSFSFMDVPAYDRFAGLSGTTFQQLSAATGVPLELLLGTPVKWLGDGVMFYFRDPAAAVLAAVEMTAVVVGHGLPPAHVGVCAGPVIFQEGDYFGRTVNLAARIAEYARPGQVLVSQEVVDAAQGGPVSFTELGPVALKGVPRPLRLSIAHRSA
jgi:class 3 adenylate cyclase